ncbi:hypothetical protein ACI3PL_22670, partial [Lacticaseibacillus paracasei]
SLRQLRAALHTIEQEKLNAKSKVINKKAATKRPKLIAHRNGGVIQKFQVGGVPFGPATIAQAGMMKAAANPAGPSQPNIFYNYLKTGKM